MPIQHSAPNHTLSSDQEKALNITIEHNKGHLLHPLCMVIQGTAGTGKSHLIKCIFHSLNDSIQTQRPQILILAPTGVAVFNINATKVHSTLKIPIRDMHPLNRQALTTFQEGMKYIKYILIDEMSFIGPKLLLKIDTRLREAFPTEQSTHFGVRSIILTGDLAQLLAVLDKPLYAAHSDALAIWREFTTVVTLHTIFRQQGEAPTELHFKQALRNICNAEPMQQDWDLLMTRCKHHLPPEESKEFDNSIHIFATNDSATTHNGIMLKQLNQPIAMSTTINIHNNQKDRSDEDQLAKNVLLCKGQHIMLTVNIWTQAGLVNGAVGNITEIVHNPNSKLPDIPMYIIARVDNYTGPVWDPQDPKCVLITPITLGN